MLESGVGSQCCVIPASHGTAHRWRATDLSLHEHVGCSTVVEVTCLGIVSNSGIAH